MRSHSAIHAAADPRPEGGADGAEALRLLFAGGCHVGGFPVGEEFGFVRTTAARLGPSLPQGIEVRTLLHVSLASTARIVEACRACRPQVLVLQLGHYESSLPLAKRMARLLRGRMAGEGHPVRDVSSWTPNYEPNPALRFRDSWRRRAKSALKLAIDGLLRLLGRPAFKRERLQRLLAQMLDEVRALGIPQVVVLSPFPVRDLTIARYRRQLRLTLALEAARHGCQFLDVSGIGQQQPRGEWFADDRHLGRKGHHAVGLLLAEKIGALLTVSAAGQRECAAADGATLLSHRRVERAPGRIPALQS